MGFNFVCVVLAVANIAPAIVSTTTTQFPFNGDYSEALYAEIGFDPYKQFRNTLDVIEKFEDEYEPFYYDGFAKFEEEFRKEKERLLALAAYRAEQAELGNFVVVDDDDDYVGLEDASYDDMGARAEEELNQRMSELLYNMNEDEMGQISDWLVQDGNEEYLATFAQMVDSQLEDKYQEVIEEEEEIVDALSEVKYLEKELEQQRDLEKQLELESKRQHYYDNNPRVLKRESYPATSRFVVY